MPKPPSSKEIEKIIQKRTIYTGEQLKNGAEYKIDNKGNEILSVTDEQIESAKKEMEQDKNKENMESHKIKFPEDINIAKALQAKLSEYEERLRSGKIENPNKPPDADISYRVAMLQELLLKGEVDGQELFKKITSEADNTMIGGISKEPFYFEAFDKAYKIIEDYAKTGGKNNVGGTGLKFEKKQEERENETEQASKNKDTDTKKDIEKKIESMTGKERDYFDSFKKHAEDHDNVLVLHFTGQLTQEGLNSIEKNIMLPFYQKNIEPLKEEIGEEKSKEIRKLIGKMLQDTKNRKIIDKNWEIEKNKSKEIDWKNISFKNKELLIENISKEIINNEKMKAIFDKESFAGLQHQKIDEDLQSKMNRFLNKFATKKDFESSEKYGKRTANNEKEWENQFGETYEESLKELSVLLYEDSEKYQKEKYKKIENDISNAKSFDDLYEVIKASGGMQSSQDFFKPKDLLDLIEQFQRGGKTINAITNSFGLRQKVIELTKLGEIRKNLQL